MIARNKTNEFKTVTLKDGSQVTARPFRSITLDEKLLSSSLSDEWEVVEKKAKVTESVPEEKVVKNTTRGKIKW